MMKIISLLPRYLLIFAAVIIFIVGLLSYAFTSPGANALSGSDFNPGNIIDDGVFYYPNTMTVAEIQNFLEDMLDNPTNRPDGVKGSCDTNGSEPSEFGGGTRAQYAASNPNDSVHDPPYICLSQYYENTTTHENNLRGRPVPSGAKSAAQIIYNVSQSEKINPRVLIVLLQKEQILVTDDWPVEIQYRSATGYGCSDSAACDSQYYGFYNQVYRAAYQFNLYRLYPSSYTHRAGVSNNVRFSPIASCGTSSVFIENQATAGLYNYTPYQPNQAALNNLYGLGDGCSAYGNRNFWRLFSDWFGSTQTNTPYAWLLDNVQVFLDESRALQYTSNIINMQPGEKAYVSVSVRNMGNQTWNPGVVRLGTSIKNDRISSFSSVDWIKNNRPAEISTSSVDPGEPAVFDFSITAPSVTGTYYENYNVVADGVAWMNPQNLKLTINVTPVGPTWTTNNSLLNQNMDNKSFLVAENRLSSLAFQNNGELMLRVGHKQLWSSGTSGSSASRLAMQSDGNLVLYTADNESVWDTRTMGNPGARLVLQNDGNLVIYSSSNTPLWSSGTRQRPTLNDWVVTEISETRLYPEQFIQTADRKNRLIMQHDGNLVLYHNNAPVWASSSSYGKDVAFLSIQTDGNLVVYAKSGEALWSSNTQGNQSAKLRIQADGNLVIYKSTGGAIWSTATNR